MLTPARYDVGQPEIDTLNSMLSDMSLMKIGASPTDMEMGREDSSEAMDLS